MYSRAIKTETEVTEVTIIIDHGKGNTFLNNEDAIQCYGPCILAESNMRLLLSYTCITNLMSS